MKDRKFYLSAMIYLTVLLMVTGCTGSFEDINIDPDNTNDAPMTNVLAYCIRTASDKLFDPWCDMNDCSTYGGHLTKIQYIDESRYEFRSGIIETKWEDIYVTYNNVKALEQRAAEEDLTNMAAVAKVWQVVMIQIATDSWRDVPYTDAGRMDEGILLPVYDTQETIYPRMIAVLAEAADMLAAGAEDELGAGDILFGGDMLKWQRFCNSLRLRLAIRISEVDVTLARSTVEQILGNPGKYPVLRDNADNAFFWWPGSSPYIEPWADDSRNRDDHGVSDILIDALKGLDDPRLPVYAHPAADGEFRGYIIGAASVSPTLNLLSRIGARFRDDFAGFTPYLRAAETYFHIAEAAKLGWNTGSTTQAAYETAVTLSLEENGVGDAAEDYLAAAAAFDDTFDQLYEQEWISLFKQGMEAWSMLRRTGTPKNAYVAPGSKYVGHNIPPFRIPYPINESGLNSANNAIHQKEVVDDFWGKQMWWDKRTNVR
jgi:hypothetical protein